MSPIITTLQLVAVVGLGLPFALGTGLGMALQSVYVVLAVVTPVLGLIVLGWMAGVVSLLTAPAVVSGVSYLAVGAGLWYVLAPHPDASSPPAINVEACRKANWREAQWKETVLEKAPKTGLHYTVVGAGFLGKKLIHTLLLRGETKIRAFDMDPTCCDAFKNDARVQFIRGDVTNYEQVLAAVRGADVVFATFAIIRYMDRLETEAALSYRINVVGTENVIKACQESGVRVLVQTSTSNVSVGRGKCSLAMDEKDAYVTRETSPNHYGWTKALAEELVLNANGVRGLKTGAIRPCSGVFGAADRHLLESVLLLGRTVLPPNGGSTVIDFVSVMNVVWGHLLLERALLADHDQTLGVSGETFCVSNNAPMRMLDFCGIVNEIRPGGVRRTPTPQRLLEGIAYAVEFSNYMGFRVKGELSKLTGATVEYLSLSYAFSSKKAEERLGYRPIFSVEQAVHMAVEEWQRGNVMLPALE